MSNTHITTLPTHFGESRLARPGPQENRIGQSPVEHRITYINNLPVDVSVGLRSGLKFPLPARHSVYNQDLTIRVELMIHPDVKFHIQRVLSVVDENSSPELRALKESWLLQDKNSAPNLMLEYKLTLEQLRSFGGSVYYHELDIVLSLARPELMPAHPYSEEGRRSQTVAGAPVSAGGAAFGYSVEIVDNMGRHGGRFLNISGTVYKVNASKDHTRRDGVYVLSNYAANGEISPDGVNVLHYSFEEAEEKLGFYRSFEEALHLGDLNAARKERLAQLEHEIALEKGETQRVKFQHDRDMAVVNKELQTLQAERDRLITRNQILEQDMSLERQRWKDFFDQRSYQRKDTGEALKILPTILMGIGTLLMAIKAFFPQVAAPMEAAVRAAAMR